MDDTAYELVHALEQITSEEFTEGFHGSGLCITISTINRDESADDMYVRYISPFIVAGDNLGPLQEALRDLIVDRLEFKRALAWRELTKIDLALGQRVKPGEDDAEEA